MKKTLTLIAAVFCAVSLLADPVSKDQAAKYAERFVELYFTSSRSVDEVLSYSSDNGTILYHFVKLNPVGWVIIAGDDILKPVIGYSPDRKLVPREEMEESAKLWFEHLDRHILSSLQRSDIPVNEKWKSIYKEQYAKSIDYVDPVSPLLTVTWNQGSGWNRFCPEDPDGPGGRVWVGCVAVSMAQAMSYYEYPVQPRGEHGYQPDGYAYQYVNYDNQQPYDWSSMSASSSDDENARLLYHLAVAVDMGFAPDGSGAYTSRAPSVLKEYFGYSETLNWKKRENFTDEVWNQMVMNELYEGRPLIYSGNGGPDGGGGHAFNVDGIGTDGSFHLNWGWSGSGNGYYSLDALTPGGDHDYSYGQGAVFAFRPIMAGPYDINLETTTVYDQQPVGTEVCEVQISDEFEGNVYTYELKGPFNVLLDDYGPANFYMEDGILKTGKVFDSEEKDSDLLRITVTDSAGTSFTKQFEISIEKYFYGPTELALEKASAEEGKDPGHLAGLFSVTDDITENTYSYSFIGGYVENNLIDADCFYVRNDSLFTNKMFDMSVGEEYFVEVTLTDAYQHTLVDTFTIDITENISGGTGSFVAENNSLKIYPNPSEGNLTVDFSGNAGRADLKFYNITGQLCGGCTVNSGDRIDISYLPEGVYYAVVLTGTDRKVQKLFLSK